MKIYTDENIERSIIAGLQRRNIELRYLGKSDEFHIKKELEMKAVILTHDIDFLKNGKQSRS